MPVNISVQLKGVAEAMAGFNVRLEGEILNALDECAALVANDAKAGHPKVKEQSTRGAGTTRPSTRSTSFGG